VLVVVSEGVGAGAASLVVGAGAAGASVVVGGVVSAGGLVSTVFGAAS
jgi:hypothetical protein